MPEDYIFLSIPLIVAIIVQIIKGVIDVLKGRFTWKNYTGYGGMPSGHTALVVSLATVVGLAEGLTSPTFALCLILTILIVRDALGFRRYMADHSKAINELIKDLPDELEYKYKIQEERIGHSPAEVTVGAVLAVILSYILYVLI
jgi:acid phosphatase family membrane protein YuiD